MFSLLSLPTPILPYGYLLEILFAIILVVSLVLAIKYPSIGKRWILLLVVVGVAEFEFSHSIPPYENLAVGMLIGLVTAFGGIIIPLSYLAKLHFGKMQAKIFFVLSGCLELILGAVGILYLFYPGSEPGTFFWLGDIGSSSGLRYFGLYFGLLTIGFYSLIVGIAGLCFSRPNRAKTFLSLSGCLEVILGSIGVFCRMFIGPAAGIIFYLGSEGGILYFVLLATGFYSLVVGVAGLFFAKPEKQ
jgi:hypothetical protein